MSVLLPPWLETVQFRTPEARHTYNRFLIRYLALLHTPKGELFGLASDIGITKQALASAWNPVSYGRISDRTAERIIELMEPKLPGLLTTADFFPDRKRNPK